MYWHTFSIWELRDTKSFASGSYFFLFRVVYVKNWVTGVQWNKLPIQEACKWALFDISGCPNPKENWVSLKGSSESGNNEEHWEDAGRSLRKSTRGMERTMWSLLLKSLRHNAKVEMTATWLSRCQSEGGKAGLLFADSSCSLQKVISLQKRKVLKLQLWKGPLQTMK